MSHKNGLNALNAPNQAVNQRLSRNAMMGAYRLEKGNKGCFSPFSLAFAPLSMPKKRKKPYINQNKNKKSIALAPFPISLFNAPQRGALPCRGGCFRGGF